MEYFVYFLLSLKDNGFYIGCTTQSPKERLLNYHNKGKVKSTKPRIPFELVYVEVYVDKNIAFKREYYLKHPKGYKEKLEIVNLIRKTPKDKLPLNIGKY